MHAQQCFCLLPFPAAAGFPVHAAGRTIQLRGCSRLLFCLAKQGQKQAIPMQSTGNSAGRPCWQPMVGLGRRKSLLQMRWAFASALGAILLENPQTPKWSINPR